MTYAPGCTATPQRTSNKYRSDADEQTGSDAPHASIPPAVHAGPLARAGGPAAAPGGADPRRPARQGGPQPRSPQIAEQGSQDALRRRWTDNIEQTRTIQARLAPREPLDPAVICETERLASRFLAGRAPLFDARIRQGRIVDGHGDLLADDIFCLDDGPRILDCLDFDDRLRWLDGLDDAAFLVMDLERLGASALAEQFMAAYAEYSGDPAPASLRHHYVAYRAFVRAKIACLRGARRTTRRPASRHATWPRWRCGTCAQARSPWS
jgi:hypothetical protein